MREMSAAVGFPRRQIAEREVGRLALEQSCPSSWKRRFEERWRRIRTNNQLERMRSDGASRHLVGQKVLEHRAAEGSQVRGATEFTDALQELSPSCQRKAAPTHRL